MSEVHVSSVMRMVPNQPTTTGPLLHELIVKAIGTEYELRVLQQAMTLGLRKIPPELIKKMQK